MQKSVKLRGTAPKHGHHETQLEYQGDMSETKTKNKANIEET